MREGRLFFENDTRLDYTGRLIRIPRIKIVSPGDGIRLLRGEPAV
jgi:hypothetical protein